MYYVPTVQTNIVVKLSITTKCHIIMFFLSILKLHIIYYQEHKRIHTFFIRPWVVKYISVKLDKIRWQVEILLMTLMFWKKHYHYHIVKKLMFKRNRNYWYHIYLPMVRQIFQVKTDHNIHKYTTRRQT